MSPLSVSVATPQKSSQPNSSNSFAATGTLKLYATSQDPTTGRAQVVLPGVAASEVFQGASATQLAAMRAAAEEVAALRSNINNHSRYFTDQQFTAYSDHVEGLTQAMARHRKAGDATAYERKLKELHTILSGMNSFVEFEKSQGLAGTCVDSGVRVYVRGDKVWLCSPDEKAFKDLRGDVQSRLKDFVKGVTGVTVEFNSASFQESGANGPVALLGCRLDPLTLQQLNRDAKYSVRTKLRHGGEFVDTTIAFTFGELKAGDVPGIFGNGKALPPVGEGPQADDPQQDAGASKNPRPGVDSLRLLPFGLVRPQTPVPVPGVRPAPGTGAAPEVSPAPRPAAPAPEPKPASALEARAELRRVAAVDAADPLKVNGHLEALRKTQKAFEDAIRERRLSLQPRVMFRAPDGESIAAMRAIVELESSWSEDLMLRKTLLERQLTSSDPKLRSAAQGELVGIASDVDAIYRERLRRADLSPEARTAITAERDAFLRQSAECRRATAGVFRRLFDTGRSSLQKLSAAAEGVMPSMGRVRGWVEKGWAGLVTPRVPLPVDEYTAWRVLNNRFNLRQDIIEAREKFSPQQLTESLSELESSQAAFDRALKLSRAHYEQQKKSSPWATAEHTQAEKKLRFLDWMEAKDTVLRSELRVQQLEHTNGAAQARLRASLERSTPSVLKAYETLLADALGDAEKARIQASRDAFGARVEAPHAARGALRGWLNRAASGAWGLGQVKLSLPGVSRARAFLSSWGERAVMAEAESVLARLREKSVGSTTAAELSSLERSSKRFKTQIRELSGRTDAASAERVKTLKNADAESIVRRSEVLERQLAEASDSKKQAVLKQQLHSQAAEIEGAYCHLERAEEGTRFKGRVEHYASEVDRATKVAAYSSDAKVADAIKLRQQAESNLAKSVAGSTEHGEHSAMRSIAIAREDLAVAEAEYAALREQQTKARGGALDTEVETKRAEVVRLREAHANERATFSKLRVENAKTKLADFVARIEKGTAEGKLSWREVGEAFHERRALVERLAELTAKHERLLAEGLSGPLKTQLADLHAQLKQAQTQLRAERNAAQRPALEKSVAELQRQILESERQVHQIEARSCQSQREGIAKVVGEIDENVSKAKAENRLDVVKQLEKTRQAMENRSAVLATNQEYHSGMAAATDAKIKVETLRVQQAVVQAKLEALRTEPALTDDGRRAVVQLEQELSELRAAEPKAQTEALAAEKSVKVSTGRALKQSLQRFEARLNGAGDWAKRNPIKAATVIAAVSEGMKNATAASYDPEARHTAIPSLFLLLDSDLEDGFFGVPVQFQTKDAGIFLSAVSEFGAGAGNAAVVMGGFTALQKIASNTVGRIGPGRWVGNKLSTATAGRVLVVGGAAVDGFMTFYDYNSWKDDDSVKLAGKTASPVMLGAGFGAFFGPPGAVIGGFAGAVGELGGLLWAWRSVDREFARDVRKQGVRETIRQAEEGYVYPDGHPARASRSRDLADYERDAIGDLAKLSVLAQIFAPKGGWSHEDLQRLGFRVDSSEDAGSHNSHRLNQLLEQPSCRWMYNLIGDKVRISANESQKAFDAHPDLLNSLHSLRERNENYFRDKYIEGPRVTMQNQSDRIAKTNERGQMFAEAAQLFRERMAGIENELKENNADRGDFEKEICEAQWRVLVEKFPQLGRILANDQQRRDFFNMFQAASGIDLETSEFWRVKSATPVGGAFVRQVMPEESKTMMKVGLRGEISRLDKLAEDFLK